MREVGHHLRIHAARDLADTFEIDRSWIRRRTAYKKLWLVFFGYPLQFIVIDPLGIAVDAVVRNILTDS